MGKREFEIRGSNDMLYGHLKATSKTLSHVIRGGKSIMEIQGNSVSLDFFVRSKQGQELASASKTTDAFDGEEHLEFRVQPGVDAVMILLCILGIVLVIPPRPD